ncbi:Mov34/MPN/PAD-1 family protein [Streptomyces sp. NBC_00631]|uniref:Mov34/MPN/PAD-1 family protein n=1 Tax=Streptomyces sp. NBC_00631 TaxID=2975793 RepID=UPI00386EF568
MTVHRRTPLPTGPARGRLLVAEGVLAPTRAALQASSGSDGRRHEGVVLWLGRVQDTTTLVLAAATPPAVTSSGRVHLDENAVGAVARTARARGLGVIAQVHSHPGQDTRHSDGDDQLVLMPFEGMFSLVAAAYGTGALHPEQVAGLHQYQDGRWVHITDPAAMIIIPAHLSIQELR